MARLQEETKGAPILARRPTAARKIERPSTGEGFAAIERERAGRAAGDLASKSPGRLL
jgi:hypothetical protein